LGIKYDPAIGIYGMDLFVVLGRPGLRIAKKKRKRGVIGKRQRITKAEAQKWFIDNCEGVILKGVKKVSKKAKRGGFQKKKKAAKGKK
jgi:large subunit ribosomal protein L11e